MQRERCDIGWAPGAGVLRAMMSGHPLTILGGGISGLAVAYFARKRGCPFTLYEAGDQVGGNAVTFRWNDFFYDSGAYRLHDKDPEMTAELRSLLGEDLLKIEAPSQIFCRSKYLDFPLSPLDLIVKLGLARALAGAASLAIARLRHRPMTLSLHDFAVGQYGRPIAETFLLGYSEKLWGISAHDLSPDASGKPLKGLTLGTLARELLQGRAAKTRHLDGTCYYPREGIGSIVEQLADACGAADIHCNAPVTRILHDGRQITGLECGNHGRIPVATVVSTIPLDAFVALLDPPLGGHLAQASLHVRFRDVILVALFLDKERVTTHGSVYFPERRFPMTRIYEPKNRSPLMAPPRQTSLVAEIPCDAEDNVASGRAEAIFADVRAHLIDIGWIRPQEILGGEVRRLRNAHPALGMTAQRQVSLLLDALHRLQNLRLVGRNATLSYGRVHDQMRSASSIVSALMEGGNRIAEDRSLSRANNQATVPAWLHQPAPPPAALERATVRNVSPGVSQLIQRRSRRTRASG